MEILIVLAIGIPLLILGCIIIPDKDAERWEKDMDKLFDEHLNKLK